MSGPVDISQLAARKEAEMDQRLALFLTAALCAFAWNVPFEQAMSSMHRKCPASVLQIMQVLAHLIRKAVLKEGKE